MRGLTVSGYRLAGAALMLLLVGCGYNLVGKGSYLDPTIHTIEVPAFVNRTTRVELEQRVTQAVADEFVSRGRLRLVTDPKGADAILRGSIDSFGINPVAFNPQGRAMMVFGRKTEASDENAHPWEHPNPPRPAQDGRYRQPTDVTWDPEGNIFISDGYVNSRVAKLDKNGDWVKSWGGPVTNRTAPGPGEFNTPHTIAADAQGNIYIGDRGNRRIQVYDHDGNFKKMITIDVPVAPNAKSWFSNAGTQQEVATAGAPWAICITPGPGTQYLYSSDAYPGRIYKLSLDGKVLGWLGRSGRQPKEFGWIHEMACPSENELYVAEILNWRVQKLTLKPGK